MRKSLKPKADGDYENFMNLAKQMPTFEQVMPQVTMAEIKQIRKKIDDMEYMHPLAVIAVSVVISVLIVIPFTL
jgi:fido (protein-threonine AMPylation protein)